MRCFSGPQPSKRLPGDRWHSLLHVGGNGRRDGFGEQWLFDAGHRKQRNDSSHRFPPSKKLRVGGKNLGAVAGLRPSHESRRISRRPTVRGSAGSETRAERFVPRCRGRRPAPSASTRAERFNPRRALRPAPSAHFKRRALPNTIRLFEQKESLNVRSE